MSKVIKAPQPFVKELGVTFIFLAGSIEMGKAENWQERVERELADQDVVILNPRRNDWDSSWIQSIDNPQFREQVEWELNSMHKADIVVMYFDSNTQSPITLLELGLHAMSGKLIVCCPEGFYRKGNVDVVCSTYHIEQVKTLDQLIERLKQ